MTQQQPPSEPQRHPCRCETCECGKKRVRILYPSGEEKTRLVKCSKLNRTLTHEEVDIVSLVGCASHSANTGAQARIDAVVKELERKQAKAANEISYQYLDQDTYRIGIVDTCKAAIVLLKEGVGK